MKWLLKVLCVLACVAVMSGCAYEQAWDEALTPDELTLSAARGNAELGSWFGVSMPEADTTAYGISLTWKLK